MGCSGEGERDSGEESMICVVCVRIGGMEEIVCVAFVLESKQVLCFVDGILVFSVEFALIRLRESSGTTQHKREKINFRSITQVTW